MYQDCVFCQKSLESNEAVAAFPVGTEVAFDPRRGRVWAVCGGCGRWNLAPAEDATAAMDALEHAYAESPEQNAKGRIGVARVRGARLVRVDPAATWGDFAAWRFAPAFTKRHRIATGLSFLGFIAFFNGRSLLLGVRYGGLWFDAAVAALLVLFAYQAWRPAARVTLADGRTLRIRFLQATQAVLGRGTGGAVELRVTAIGGPATVSGVDLDRTLAAIMPVVNNYGGTKSNVKKAIGLLAGLGGADGLVARAAWPAELSAARTRGLRWYPLVTRLALEMAGNEAAERVGLEEERTRLAGQLLEAEEVAGEVDGMG